MKDLWDDGTLLRILLFGVLIALMGLAPISNTVINGFESARRAQHDSNSAVAAQNLATVAEQQPWRIGLWEAAGHAALAAGNAQAAVAYFAQAAAKGELSPDGYLAWGDADWQLERPQTALQIWQIGERVGLTPEVIFPRLIEVYRFLGDDLDLIETLKSMLNLQRIGTFENNSTVLYHELGMLLAAYDPAAAPAYLLQAAELDPSLEAQTRSLSFAIERELSKDDPVYLLVIAGQTLAQQGYWELAEKAFGNAVEQNPEYAEAWAYLGEAQQHTLSGADPLTSLQTALELDPDSLAANTFLALYWQRQEEHEKALKAAQAAAKLDPDNPALWVQIGGLTALLGDLDKGQSYYRRAMDLQPNDPRFVREFLKFCLQYNLDLREVALPVARQLVISNSGDPTSLDVMGEVLLRLGDLHNSERFFLRALAQNPEYDQAHFHLGGLYRLQGKMGLSEYHYRQALEVTKNLLTMNRVQQALDEYFSP